jgi:hypothetical protein
VNARNRPSGDQVGLASWSPAVTGASSIHTRLVVVFRSRSVVATTNETWLPSGLTATWPTTLRPSIRRSAISRWERADDGASLVDTDRLPSMIWSRYSDRP